jgi:outer membrane protein assembly factor BamE
MRNFYIAVLLLSFTLLAGCGTKGPALKPFKMDIQQGNVVTSKMLLQLRPGMTKSQVRFIMGTPLVVDSFHKDRWDYFYQLRQAGKVVEQRRVILDFEKDLLSKVRGDVVPEGTAGAAKDGTILGKQTEIPAKKEEKSFMDKLKFWKKDEVKPTAPLEIKPDAQPMSKEMSKELPKAKDMAPAGSDLPSLDTPNADIPAADEAGAAVETPSVLAVPIEIPAVDAIPKVETPKAPAQKKMPVAEPVKAEPVKPATPEAAPAEDKVLRMDKTLEDKKMDLKADKPKVEVDTQKPVKPDVKQDVMKKMPKEVVPKEVAPKEVIKEAPKEMQKVETKAAPAAKPVDTEPTAGAPAEADGDPTYFDRLLEKIGF